ncbi:MAG: hypothetical protein KTR16_08785 [Acidiferrobacterales bacterium]|nr:hypothetical protein [Acidiferrobacterales bacterium]
MTLYAGLTLIRRAGIACLFLLITGSVFHSNSVKAEDMGFSVWELKESECQTRMTFLGSEKVLYESGDQAATKNYRFKRIKKGEFYRLKMKTTHTNFKRDCRGSKGTGVGDSQNTYVRFDDAKSQMTFYAAPEESAGVTVTFQKLVFEEN